MIPSLIDMVWGCWHTSFTRPLTTTTRHTYVVCLDCGTEFAYDTARMRIGNKLRSCVTHVPDVDGEQRDGLLLARLTRMVQMAEVRARGKR